MWFTQRSGGWRRFETAVVEQLDRLPVRGLASRPSAGFCRGVDAMVAEPAGRFSLRSRMGTGRHGFAGGLGVAAVSGVSV